MRKNTYCRGGLIGRYATNTTQTLFRFAGGRGIVAPTITAEGEAGVLFMPNPSNKNTLESVRANFHKYFTVADRGYETPCWEWHKTDPTTGGYGIVTISGRKWKAHRLSWTLFKGTIPEGLCVCHHCDNPPCANFNHFFVGTRTDNIRDAEAKHRIEHVKGIDHPLAKLTEDDVRYMRSNYKRYSRTGPNSHTFAKQFGVAHSLISRILKGQSWPHVEGGASG